MTTSPHVRAAASVRSVMLRVLLAMTPGLLAFAWFFGPAAIFQVALASLTALLAEALVLLLRRKPLWLHCSDGSAVVTAWLLALAAPPGAPWWLVVTGVLIAIVIAKHLYGGLGQNPFNPAMVAFCALIVAWPQYMSQWPALDAAAAAQSWRSLFAGDPGVDAIVMATPLDHLRTLLRTSTQHDSVASLIAIAPANDGWLWLAAAWLAGGLWLLQQRLITWHAPITFLVVLCLLALVSSIADPLRFAGPGFHLFYGGAMLGAFFIITDPVSGCTTPLGKLIFAAGAALLTWLIRNFGAFPDGVAFAVVLMNLLGPLIDMHTQPRVFGRRRNDSKPSP